MDAEKTPPIPDNLQQLPAEVLTVVRSILSQAEDHVVAAMYHAVCDEWARRHPGYDPRLEHERKVPWQ
jgi:hypothetical protein